MATVRERAYHGLPGIPVLLLLLAVTVGLVLALIAAIRAQGAIGIVASAVALAIDTLLMVGYFW